MSDTGLFTRPGLDQTIPVAAVLGSLAAAAWVILASGTVGHTSHDVVLGSGQPPQVGTLVAFLGNWQLMVVATMLAPAIPTVAARARRTQRWWATTSAVVATTCAVWAGFAVAMLAGDSTVHRLVAAWPWLGQQKWLVTSAMLVLADPTGRARADQHRRAGPTPRRRAALTTSSTWRIITRTWRPGEG